VLAPRRVTKTALSNKLRAILWDVDGTLAETEADGHRVAFNLAFESLGLPWRWDERRYGELLHITGGRERILHDMASHRDAPVLVDERLQLARELHARKNTLYGRWLRGHKTVLREGVAALIEEGLQQGVRQAIVTTTSRVNVEALLRWHFATHWRTCFAAVVSGDDVLAKKPDPEGYQRCLQLLHLSPLRAVAIEDSPGGAIAARAAGVSVVVTRSRYFADAQIDHAVAIGPGLHTRQGWQPRCGERRDDSRVTLDDLRHWCEQMESVSQSP
jgi:HAD superfamily hydrolase (TIGR01509 family)